MEFRFEELRTGVGSEDRAAALPLVADDTTLIMSVYLSMFIRVLRIGAYHLKRWRMGVLAVMSSLRLGGAVQKSSLQFGVRPILALHGPLKSDPTSSTSQHLHANLYALFPSTIPFTFTSSCINLLKPSACVIVIYNNGTTSAYFLPTCAPFRAT